ncbi:MAG: hypothetical protein AAGC81_12775 [Pseudomonadota bacterium]
MIPQNAHPTARNLLPPDAITGRIWGDDPHDATITWEREGLRSRTVIDMRFVDLTNPRTSCRQSIMSDLATALTLAPELLCIGHQAEIWQIGNLIGGTLARDSVKGVPLSEGWTRRVSANLQSRFARTVSRAWAHSLHRDLTLQPGHLHKITTPWTLTLTCAEVSWGDETGRIDVLTAAEPEPMQTTVVDPGRALTARECLALYGQRRPDA